ncbi:hypothetical protein D3C72_534890 [compost metagenome]
MPVPGPPMNTTFCAVSVNSRLDKSLTRRASALEALKSKPAKSRCMGSLAMFIWWFTERTARSACSCWRRCSSSHFDEVVEASPCEASSSQALAMPCRRSSLSSALRSRIASLLIGGTEPVVACRIGDRRYLELKAGFGGRRGCCRCQSSQDIQDVVSTQAA